MDRSTGDEWKRVKDILTDKHVIWTAVFIGIFVLLVLTAWCEAPEACLPTPDPFPPDGVVLAGTHRIPPRPPETVVKIKTSDGTMGVLSLQDWRMVVDWVSEEPDFWPSAVFPDEVYWFLENYHSYCRFDCDNFNTDPAEDPDWHCISECWAAFADNMIYQFHESLDCGETWPLIIEEEISYVPPVLVRRANLRLAPADD